MFKWTLLRQAFCYWQVQIDCCYINTVITKAPRWSIPCVSTKIRSFCINTLIRNPSAVFCFWLLYDKWSREASKILLSHLGQVSGKEWVGKPNTLFAYTTACPINHFADRDSFIIHLIPAYVNTLTVDMKKWLIQHIEFWKC